MCRHNCTGKRLGLQKELLSQQKFTNSVIVHFWSVIIRSDLHDNNMVTQTTEYVQRTNRGCAYKEAI